MHYTNHPLAKCLWPISLVYQSIITVRKFLYQKNIFKQARLSVPVIVVGNITTGGTGKTPLVIYLAQQLKKQGFKPGIISRGYKAQTNKFPCNVFLNALAEDVGDEPLLIHKCTQSPVVIDPNRVRGANYLIAKHACNIIISDDGLQHYALARDIEIAVVDASRRFGNAYCLPAGPLREPVSRLNEVSFVVYNGYLPPAFAKATTGKKKYHFSLNPDKPVNLQNPNYLWTPIKKVHAVAGIGHPQRFFETLKALDFEIIEHAFPDHHAFKPSDICFNDDLPVMMTEKDAVKCFSFAKPQHWYLPVSVEISDNFIEKLMNRVGQARMCVG